VPSELFRNPFLNNLPDGWEKFFRPPGQLEYEEDIGGCQRAGPGKNGYGRDSGAHGNRYLSLTFIGAGTPKVKISVVDGGLARNSINAMSGIEREDYLRGREFAFPAFIESVLKTQRMSEAGVTVPRGKIFRDEKRKPIRLKAGQGIAQAAGSRSGATRPGIRIALDGGECPEAFQGKERRSLWVVIWKRPVAKGDNLPFPQKRKA
jgi:hypothetical protein